jgi:hypothetical protein
MGLHRSKQKSRSAQSADPTISQHFPTQVSPHYIQLDPIYYAPTFVAFLGLGGHKFFLFFVYINCKYCNLITDWHTAFCSQLFFQSFFLFFDFLILYFLFLFLFFQLFMDYHKGRRKKFLALLCFYNLIIFRKFLLLSNNLSGTCT